jgi:hypothetical protein
MIPRYSIENNGTGNSRSKMMELRTVPTQLSSWSNTKQHKSKRVTYPRNIHGTVTEIKNVYDNVDGVELRLWTVATKNLLIISQVIKENSWFVHQSALAIQPAVI